MPGFHLCVANSTAAALECVVSLRAQQRRKDSLSAHEEFQLQLTPCWRTDLFPRIMRTCGLLATADPGAKVLGKSNDYRLLVVERILLRLPRINSETITSRPSEALPAHCCETADPCKTEAKVLGKNNEYQLLLVAFESSCTPFASNKQ